MKLVRTVVDFIRGALIGVVEIIPGVSGGTIALIIGVYEKLIASIGEFVRGVVRIVTDAPRGQGTARAREHFGQVSWSLVLPLAVGMVVALLTAARIVAPLVEDHPVEARALFAGLILVALIVPARMVGGRWGTREWALALPAAVAAFVLTGLPAPSPGDPNLVFVAVAGAIAVCALAMPGLSGSFILLIFGLYEPTLDALNDRDIAYLAAFLGGMTIGLALFVQALRWLLEHRRRVTLALMTGLMAGSLRALWPWQGEDRELHAPSGDVAPVVGWFVLGIVIVAAILIVESLLVRRRLATGEDVLDPETEPAED